MEPNFGNVIETVRAPERMYKSKKAVNYLILLVPSLLCTGVAGVLLSQNVKISSVVVWAVCIGFCLIIPALGVWSGSKRAARYAEQVLEIRERGVCGVRPVSAFKSKSFAIPYSELKSADGLKKRLTLRSDSERFFMVVENAEECAAKLRQVGGIH